MKISSKIMNLDPVFQTAQKMLLLKKKDPNRLKILRAMILHQMSVKEMSLKKDPELLKNPTEIRLPSRSI